ncbi:hypothetical protein [Bacillus thuringiensis]|uniref:hypothetical protein n=1 Tax=Bacillus thuringiensis TaxID=1428 RepID=UPI0021D688AD|nr:hypothetical protein [Bacillus thuringiensis]MCU7666840.1 hypothetical protein [Bacillus thuringiensis]
MSKKYLFNRYQTLEENITYAEKKQRREQGLEINNFLSLSMSANDFMDKLFGITEFYFVPQKDGVIYQKNMIEKLTQHSLFLLNQASNEINSELYSLMMLLLVGFSKLIETEGWKSNRLIVDEILSFNEFMNQEELDNISLHVTETPLLTKYFNFYVDKERDKIITENSINPKEYNNFEPYVLYHELNYTSVEKLECAINVLSELLLSLKPKKSYSKTDINYMFGETDDYIHEEVICAAGMFGMSLGYIINSTSWRENELFVFDRIELERRTNIRMNEEYCRYYVESVN